MQTEIDTVLQPPRQGANREELRQHLQLLVETFKRARSLAEDLQVWDLRCNVDMRLLIPAHAVLRHAAAPDYLQSVAQAASHALPAACSKLQAQQCTHGMQCRRPSWGSGPGCWTT